MNNGKSLTIFQNQSVVPGAVASQPKQALPTYKLARSQLTHQNDSSSEVALNPIHQQ